MQILSVLLYLLLYLGVDWLFRQFVINPVLREHDITPFDIRKHAKYRAIADYFDYCRYVRKDLFGLLGITFAIGMHVVLFWLLFQLPARRS